MPQLETTEAINRDYVRAQMHPAAREEGSLVDPSTVQVGHRGDVQSRRFAKRPGAKQLSGYGWGSDSVEREFARSVVDEVQRKKPNTALSLRTIG